jgi:L-fuconate dehydratase
VKVVSLETRDVRRDGHYLAPDTPGMSAQIKAESLTEYAYPDGPAWRS